MKFAVKSFAYAIGVWAGMAAVTSQSTPAASQSTLADSHAQTTSGIRVQTENSKDLLIKFKDSNSLRAFIQRAGKSASTESLGGTWIQLKTADQRFNIQDLRKNPNVLVVQPNYPLHLFENYRLTSEAERARLINYARNTQLKLRAPADNPDIPMPSTASGSGSDPDFDKQWGMKDIGVKNSWSKTRGAGAVVAVIDTGVDYTHEDLKDNLWYNQGEMGKDSHGNNKATNAIDDDSNGFVDDVIGWDFASNDNKPFDLAMDPFQVVTQGGNPGHGTHCAGNVGARADNGKGTVGVAPEVKIMPIRFLNEKGQGDTAVAVKSINYAVMMGATVLSNSWGSEGDDPTQAAENQALRDAISNAQAHDVLFVAAAGNGHSGVGYDNDTDAKPGVPASYDNENIVSVAAIDEHDALGPFSNWGSKTVDLAAPGVKVFSTTVGSKYSDTVIDFLGITAYWDGTSMAAPHVAGAAALYRAAHPHADFRQVKQALLSSTKPISAMAGKSVSGGKLNVENLMNQ